MGGVGQKSEKAPGTPQLFYAPRSEEFFPMAENFRPRGNLLTCSGMSSWPMRDRRGSGQVLKKLRKIKNLCGGCARLRIGNQTMIWQRRSAVIPNRPYQEFFHRARSCRKGLLLIEPGLSLDVLLTRRRVKWPHAPSSNKRCRRGSYRVRRLAAPQCRLGKEKP